MAWDLLSARHSHLVFFGLGDNWRLTLSSSWNSPVLLAPPLLPAWLLASQGFTETVQDRCTRASSSIFLMESWFHVNLSTKWVFTFRVHTRRVESFGAGIPALVISSRVVPIVQGIDAFQTVCSCLTVHFPLGVYVHWDTRTCTFLWVCVKVRSQPWVSSVTLLRIFLRQDGSLNLHLACPCGWAGCSPGHRGGVP